MKRRLSRLWAAFCHFRSDADRGTELRR